MLIQDVREIKLDQQKILQAIAGIDGPLIAAINVASESAAAASASCAAALDVLNRIAASLETIATVQTAMAADLVAIKSEVAPDTNPVGIGVDLGKPTERP